MLKYMGFRRKEWLFLLRWTVATAIGCTVGSPFIVGVLFVVGLAASDGGSLGNLTTLILFTLVNFIIGTSIGFGQTLALIGQVKQPILWIQFSILGGTLGGLIVGLLSLTSLQLASFLSVAVPGIFLSIAQKVVLIKFLKKATGWITANIISWTLAQVLFIVAALVDVDIYRIFNIIEDGFKNNKQERKQYIEQSTRKQLFFQQFLASQCTTSIYRCGQKQSSKLLTQLQYFEKTRS